MKLTLTQILTKMGYLIGIVYGYNWAKFEKDSPKEAREN